MLLFVNTSILCYVQRHRFARMVIDDVVTDCHPGCSVSRAESHRRRRSAVSASISAPASISACAWNLYQGDT